MNNNFCIDCSVFSCWKNNGRFIAIGSPTNPKAFICPRKKRLHLWSEVKKYRLSMLKHLTILTDNGHVHYLCNQGCTVTATKIAGSAFKVTCKNCLQIMKNIKSGKDMQEYIRGKK